MKPIIILPNGEQEITIKAEELIKHLNDAYDNGYEYGYEKGKNEINKPFITYRGIDKIDTTPYCGAEITTALYNQTTEVNNGIQRSK